MGLSWRSLFRRAFRVRLLRRLLRSFRLNLESAEAERE
jgi:hypothetical protein